jgi:hypothetical protein
MKIDSVGVFIGEIVESGVSTTQKSGYPQWVARLKAVKKYIDIAEEITHFGLEGPGYVDWSSFNEDIVCYLVLFNNEKALLNYEQVQLATGWDGAEFEGLSDPKLIGKQILFRTGENTYNDKTDIQVDWVDAADAPPQRQLKTLAPDDLKALSNKFLGAIKKVAAPAKPAAPTKPGKQIVALQKAGLIASPTSAAGVAKVTTPAAVTTAPVAAAPVTTPAPVAAAPASPPKAPKAKAAKTSPPVAEKAPAAVVSAPAETNQMDAWAYVIANKGENDDGVVEEAWIDACKEVGGEREEETFTGNEWAKIRDIVLKDIAA